MTAFILTVCAQVSFAEEVHVYGHHLPTDYSVTEMSESGGVACKSDFESGKEDDQTDQRPTQPQSSEPSQVIASLVTDSLLTFNTTLLRAHTHTHAYTHTYSINHTGIR